MQFRNNLDHFYLGQGAQKTNSFILIWRGLIPSSAREMCYPKLRCLIVISEKKKKNGIFKEFQET